MAPSKILKYYHMTEESRQMNTNTHQKLTQSLNVAPIGPILSIPIVGGITTIVLQVAPSNKVIRSEQNITI